MKIQFTLADPAGNKTALVPENEKTSLSPVSYTHLLGRDSFVLRDAEGAHFQVNWEDADSLSAGDNVCVRYDGTMSRSIPPQITGIAVEQVRQSETICGEIQSIGAGFFLLLDDDAQEIRVNFPEAASLTPGGRVCVQFNGAMTRSIPPQIAAIAVEPVSYTHLAEVCGEGRAKAWPSHELRPIPLTWHNK